MSSIYLTRTGRVFTSCSRACFCSCADITLTSACTCNECTRNMKNRGARFENGCTTNILKQKWEILKQRQKWRRHFILQRSHEKQAYRVMTLNPLRRPFSLPPPPPPNTHTYTHTHTHTFPALAALESSIQSINFSTFISKDWCLGVQFLPQIIRDWNAHPAFTISSAEGSEDCISRFTSLMRSGD